MKEKLEEAKDLFEKGLINEEEYSKRKEKILDSDNKSTGVKKEKKLKDKILLVVVIIAGIALIVMALRGYIAIKQSSDELNESLNQVQEWNEEINKSWDEQWKKYIEDMTNE